VQRFADSDNPALLDTYGWVLYRRGRYTEAIPPLEKAVGKAPQAQELRYHLGMALLKAGRTAEARENLEAAVRGEQRYAGSEEARAALAAM
jgi:Flp pilus assembly protein TadD